MSFTDSVYHREEQKMSQTRISLAAALALIFSAPNLVAAQQTHSQTLNQSDSVDIIVACERAEHDYALYRDRLDAEGFANAFTEDGEWGRSNGRIIKGRDAISSYITDAAAANAADPEYHMQFNTTIQIKPTSATSATGVSYALVLETPAPEGGGAATTVAGFQVASESRSTYTIDDQGCKIATREYTTFFVDPE